MSISCSSLTSTLDHRTQLAMNHEFGFARLFAVERAYNTAKLTFADWVKITARTLKQMDTDFGDYKGSVVGYSTAGCKIGTMLKRVGGGTTHGSFLATGASLGFASTTVLCGYVIREAESALAGTKLERWNARVVNGAAAGLKVILYDDPAKDGAPTVATTTSTMRIIAMGYG